MDATVEDCIDSDDLDDDADADDQTKANHCKRKKI